jgi:hypothetical protein
MDISARAVSSSRATRRVPLDPWHKGLREPRADVGSIAR